ncbi:Helix-hairpin-helix motif protein [Planctomycetes bacterium CA13]|uniref:Helix-hairpin-helix motif protein n=1 Tax=Novipirellula herctigrandis TaxID=2527986 RepID=A0A5C5YXE1_9BACT|nr:Helix-hairpin-helix motif protein [Planctomycetes bacterium CA13]
MGVSERKYMQTQEPKPVGFSFVLAIVTSVVVIALLAKIRDRSSYSNRSHPFNQSVEDQIQNLAPNISRHDRLLQISPMDVNVVSYDDLRLLPRVSDAIANGIISGRPFLTVEQLDDVYGIGPKTVELLRPHIVIKHDTSVQHPDRQSAEKQSIDIETTNQNN